MANTTGGSLSRYVNPLNKHIGRRTGRDVRAGKNIRRRADGLENFDDYMSESDADVTRDFTTNQTIATGTTQQSDNWDSAPTVSSCSQPENMDRRRANQFKLSLLRMKSRTIGSRTGKDVTANKLIRKNVNGLEIFDDYLSESGMSNDGDESCLDATVHSRSTRHRSSVQQPDQETSQAVAQPDTLCTDDDVATSAENVETSQTNSDHATVSDGSEVSQHRQDDNAESSEDPLGTRPTQTNSKDVSEINRSKPHAEQHNVSLSGEETHRTTTDQAESEVWQQNEQMIRSNIKPNISPHDGSINERKASTNDADKEEMTSSEDEESQTQEENNEEIENVHEDDGNTQAVDKGMTQLGLGNEHQPVDTVTQDEQTIASNIDVAGNRSGSITRLNIDTSAISFNRTKKRLSYSAIEASEESLKIKKSRIEQANAELNFTKNTEVSCVSHAEKKTVNSAGSQPARPTDVSNRPADKSSVVESAANNMPDIGRTRKSSVAIHKSDMTTDCRLGVDTKSTEDEEFICLTSRHSVTHQASQVANNQPDTDTADSDDIIIIEESEESMSFKPRRLNKSKSKKVTKSNAAKSSKNSKNVKDIKGKVKTQKDGLKSKGEKKKKMKGGHEEVAVVTYDDVEDKDDDMEQDVTLTEEQASPAQSPSPIRKRRLSFNACIEPESSVHNSTNNEHNSELANKSRKSRGKSSVSGSQQRQENSEDNDDNGKKSRKSIQLNNRQSQKKGKKQTRSENQDDNEANLENMNDDNDSRLLNHTNSVTEDKLNNTAKRRGRSKQSARKSRILTVSDVDNPSVTDCVGDVPPEDDGITGKQERKKRSSSSETSDTNTSLNKKHRKQHSKSGSEAKSARSRKARKRESQTGSVDTTEKLGSPYTSRSQKQKKSGRKKSQSIDESIGGDGGRMRRKKASSPPDDLDVGSSSNSLIHSTPVPDTSMRVPTDFGSGVSFRVARGYEMLSEMGSDYVSRVNFEMERVNGLTPCITRPGANRKKKGRRVTICPEENREHHVSPNHTPTSAVISMGRESMTPLPDPDSTPMHIFETTNTVSPATSLSNTSLITNNLIFPNPAPEGLRRSQRTRMKPVEWYKNERVILDLTNKSGPTIVGVKPSLEVKWKQLEEEKRKRRMLNFQIRKAASSRMVEKNKRLSIHTSLPDDVEVVEQPEQEITVINPFTGTEDTVECIGKGSSFRPVGPTHKSPVKEDPYLITQVLNQPCMSSGKLSIKPYAVKPEQMNVANYTVFYIEYGKMLVKIHETVTLLESGDTFMVPKGSSYGITNLRSDTARLFYVINKEVDESIANCSTPRFNTRKASSRERINTL